LPKEELAMTRRTNPRVNPGQPDLSELLADYLQRVAARPAGLAHAADAGEVTPFEAVPTQPIDPRLAWDEALAVLRWFHNDATAQSKLFPADWAALVLAQEPATAVAFAVGNFPQLVRNLQPLLQTADLATLRPTAGRPVPVPGGTEWAMALLQKEAYPQALVALGILRLARQFDRALEAVQRPLTEIPMQWQAAWANEQAALAWHQGQVREAADLWQAQPVTVPVLFNRGMAALFLGKAAEARPLLQQAVSQLPEEDAWYHLGCLYLALAEMRR
jgi:tetratricopeptide (TPR) repeat protein